MIFISLKRNYQVLISKINGFVTIWIRVTEINLAIFESM